jgi:hypothetical protein
MVVMNQNSYQNWRLDGADLLDRIQAQANFLESLRETQAPSNELDLNLLRSLCYMFIGRIREDALHDCSHLIAESVLGNSRTHSEKIWEDWFETAAVWPVLAQDIFDQARTEAAKLVLLTLKTEAAEPEIRDKKTLFDLVEKLSLRDLVTPDVYAQYFGERA